MNPTISVGRCTLLDTVFGWVVTGTAPALNHVSHNKQISMLAIDNNLNKFWELEETPSAPILTPEQEFAETIFCETTKIRPDGRYVVRIPFRTDPPILGYSRDLALSRFKSLEKRMSKDEQFAKLYKENIQDYVQKGHLLAVPKCDNANYLPHHGVFSSSVTHKLRVVFDASVVTSNKCSLNGLMPNCPKTQPDLFHVLLRFRQHKVALTADISKMYRQVHIDPEQYHLQTIVWRESPNQPIQDFVLTTVTWGTRTAPFLATRVINDIADKCSPTHPVVSPKLRQEMYVDDLLSGMDTEDAAVTLYQQIITIMGQHGFKFHKWASNSALVRSHFENKEESSTVDISTDTTCKTLGLQWDYKSDMFLYTVNVPHFKKVTKRSLLSQTNSIFDPLGWLAPVLIRPKLIIQRLWKSALSWDDQLDSQTVNTWHDVISDFKFINQVQIPRLCVPFSNAELTLCGFCDSSELAYGAVLYLRSESGSDVRITLLAAKTKVAPLQVVTLPRLELCAALLLARLVSAVRIAFNADLPVVAWSDSQIALAWIASHPSRWRTFVAHRVQEIQGIIPPSCWRFISGTENPSDVASRGCSAKSLLQLNLWWQGPEFLKSSSFAAITPVAPTSLEERPLRVITNATLVQPLFPFKSSISSTIRIQAYMLRFIHNIRKPKERWSGCLRNEELDHAERTFWKANQQIGFPVEYAILSAGKELPVSNRLLSLAPFIDSQGLIRVGGRLRKSDLPEAKKHPILLPNHPAVEKFITEQHVRHLHAGPNLLTTVIQSKFWIPNIISRLKKVLHRCVKCTRMKAATAHQMMADLPPSKVFAPSRAFTTTRVDFMGPIMLRNQIARGSKQYKAWVCLFICLATRAVHIEMVTALTATAFELCLHRFVSRRGRPQCMWSGNGTNFVATAKQLKAEEVASKQGIDWRFIPPGGPHFRSIWEANIKSLKYHVLRVIGSTGLTYEEMSTFLSRVEACLNSRPLTALSSDPNDLRALTPAHFLVQGELHAIPEPELPDKVPPLKRWLHVQAMAQHFWKRWSGEYLTRLQHRPKWLKPRPNLQVGQLVIVKDDNVSPLRWKLARILELHLGSDELARVATVKTNLSTLKKPIVKLCPLPMDE